MLSTAQATSRRLLGLNNDELEMMWKVTVVDCLKVLYRNSTIGTEENHENPKSSILAAPTRDSNQELFECKSETLPPKATYLITLQAT
jgi:hypothetical protein